MGKGSKPTVGYWYLPAFHVGLGIGPIDAYLEARGGDKTAWAGRLTASGTIHINAPNLWGGEKDQGGIVGDMDVMFGEAGQMPNPYLASTFGDQQPAWRGLATLVFKGGKYGAMSPYPQPMSHKIVKIVKGWDGDVCWYPERAEIPYPGISRSGATAGRWLFGPVAQNGAAGGSMRYYRTCDDAADWSSSTLHEAPAWVSQIQKVSTANGNVFMHAGSVANAAVSYDKGVSWEECDSPIDSSNNVYWNGDYYYCRTQRSANGKNWEVIPNLSGSPSETIARDSDGMIICAHTGAGPAYWIETSANNGASWVVWPMGSSVSLLATDGVQVQLTLGSTGGYRTFDFSIFDSVSFETAYDSVFGGAIWLRKGNGGRLLRSSDGGLSFTIAKFGTSLGSGLANTIAYSAQQAIWVIANVTAGVPAQWDLEISADSGVTWIPSSTLYGNGGNIIYIGGGSVPPSSVVGINPAHALYYARTHSEIGREPIANINDTSSRASADKLYAEAFGICTEYDPSAESLVEYEQRICNLIGGSINRSLVDGQYYLDLARGDYVLEDLPILTDDDILSFAEQPSILDNAINSVSVKYFDPVRKETIVTPPVQALALIDAFGTIHQVKDYPEIPTAALAARIAERDLRTSVTPTRAFDLVTKRKPYDWRPNTYFRLQVPKRGIADMVCLLGSKETGTLKSGAIKITAVQDIYSLPDTSYIEVEHGVDTRPPQTPVAIVLQRVFEAPYIEVVANLSRADLAALPGETGYLLAVAADPAQSRDYTMRVAPDGGDYIEANNGDWCPNATTVGGIGLEPGPVVVALASSDRLDQVVVGKPVLIDDEIFRVDAIDIVAPSVTLGRGCADTVPAIHAAGSRLWFFADHAAIDTTEYTDGETINVKLLTNTGSQQLAEDLATAMPLTFDQRQFRPYPPGLVRINGEAAPPYLFGEITATWAHRDRELQADQLVDHEMASIGPESGQTTTLRWYLDNVLVQTHSALSGTSQAYTPSADGQLRIEIESVRDSLASAQKHVRTLTYTTTESTPLETLAGDLITTLAGDPIFMR